MKSRTQVLQLTPIITPYHSKIVPLQPKPEAAFKNKLIIQSQGEIRLISASHILYCEAEGNYTRIKLVHGKNILASVCLKYILERLGQKELIRVHQSYAVPANAITAIQKTQVILDTGQAIPLSRTYRKILIASLS